MDKKNKNVIGITPAIVLINPKFYNNVNAVTWAASAFNVKQVWLTGNRIKIDPELQEMIPDYIDLMSDDKPWDQFDQDVTPVAIEVGGRGCSLPWYEHPNNAIYIFGPEDGSLDREELRLCHYRASIPTAHCLSLAQAVSVVLYDRQCKRTLIG